MRLQPLRDVDSTFSPLYFCASLASFSWTASIKNACSVIPRRAATAFARRRIESGISIVIFTNASVPSLWERGQIQHQALDTAGRIKLMNTDARPHGLALSARFHAYSNSILGGYFANLSPLEGIL